MGRSRLSQGFDKPPSVLDSALRLQILFLMPPAGGAEILIRGKVIGSKTMFTQHHSQLFQEKKRGKAASPPFPQRSSKVYQVLCQGHRLWVQGSIQKTDLQGVAIVGSRSCTESGYQSAFELSTELAESGVCVVSGLAKGIDGAAHRAALKADGRTLAVLGTGLHHIRPRLHASLYQDIIQNGACLSPFCLDFTGRRDGHNYLQRNTVIAELSKVLVVAYAKERSGSMAAARCALRAGRPVGLMSHIVNTKSWAEALLDTPGVFVVNGTEDVLRMVGH